MVKKIIKNSKKGWTGLGNIIKNNPSLKPITLEELKKGVAKKQV